MAWQDNLREAAYTSASGKRITFTYEDVKQEIDRHTEAFSFPDVDGTYVQLSGRSGRKFPVRMIFWGATHDDEASACESALLEEGVGRLEHPVYGVADVVPYGRVSRRNDLVREANQSVIEVTFWETLRLVYPTRQDNPSADVRNSLSKYATSATTDFDSAIKTDTAVRRVAVRNQYKRALETAKSAIEAIADMSSTVQTEFADAVTAANTTIDGFVTTPVSLVTQTLALVQVPAQATGSVTARLDAYGSLINAIVSGTDAVAPPNADARRVNEYHVDRM